MITITSKRDGFRRCGIAHPARPVEHANDAFSKEELDTLKNEPLLDVKIDQRKKGKSASADTGKDDA